MTEERREKSFEEDILSGCLLDFQWRVLHLNGDLILVNPINVLVIPHAVTGGGIGVTKSFQPNLRQCLPGKPPTGAEELTVTQNGPAQGGRQKATPAHKQ